MPVVERQPAVHLPVVLDVELGVVVDHAAFDELRGLQVLRGRRPVAAFAKPKVRVERVVRVVAEVHEALEAGCVAGAGVLRLEAVVVVEAALERVAAGDLRQADRDVLRPVDVQPAGIALVRRRRADAVAPAEDRRQVEPRAVPEGRLGVFHDLVRVVVSSGRRRRPDRGAGSPASRQPVGRLVHQDAALVAAGQLVADEPVRAFEERRRVQRVVDREARSS